MKIKNIKKKIERSHYTRAQAMNKLQLDLNNFRRLCIYKGIHPKDPSANERKRLIKRYQYKQDKDGNICDKKAILYKISDIYSLLNDRELLDVLRRRTTYFRKIKSAKFTNNTYQLEELKNNPIEIPFDLIIRDRYPTFQQALQDLDDCLNTMFLVSTCTLNNLISDTQHQDIISVEKIDEIKELCLQFQKYITCTNSLKKCFVGSKGIYYQAIVQDQQITWVIPHENNTTKLQDLDYDITQIYVELYMNMLKFINFKLFIDEKWIYPPKYDKNVFLQDGGIDSISIEKDENISNHQSMKEEIINMQVDLLNENEKIEYEAILKKNTKIFEGMTFYISKELPINMFKFILYSINATFGWDNNICPNSPFNEDNDMITHKLTEKKTLDSDSKIGRIYVHPQWIVDSINFEKLLDVNDYLVGREIPPHICPFENYENGEYKPDYYRKITNDNTDSKTCTSELQKNIELTKGILSRKQRNMLDQLKEKDEAIFNQNQKLEKKKTENMQAVTSAPDSVEDHDDNCSDI